MKTNVVVGDSDFNVQENDVLGVPSKRVEDDLLIFEILGPHVGERLLSLVFGFGDQAVDSVDWDA